MKDDVQPNDAPLVRLPFSFHFQNRLHDGEIDCRPGMLTMRDMHDLRHANKMTVGEMLQLAKRTVERIVIKGERRVDLEPADVPFTACAAMCVSMYHYNVLAHLRDSTERINRLSCRRRN